MNYSMILLTYLHPGDLSLPDWLALLWYWLGIPIVVLAGMYLLAKLSKWSGRSKDNSDGMKR
jgi:hypothetical protein